VQRERLLAAAIVAIDEVGYPAATVQLITRRARVSRRTFYELFDSREGCLLGVIDQAERTVEHSLELAGAQRLGWRERLRIVLGLLLDLCDRMPALARVCVVQSPRSGPLVLARREAILRRLGDGLEQGRPAGRRGWSSLTGEALAGAALQIVHTRLLTDGARPLVELEGELMSALVLPYLGAAAARRELSRKSIRTAASERAAEGSHGVDRGGGDPFEGLAMRVTYRTARVLSGATQRPGSSNRELAERAGIVDQGQASKLLIRLERLGLLQNTGDGHARGGRNAWVLTERGKRVAQCVQIQDHDWTAGRNGTREQREQLPDRREQPPVSGRKRLAGAASR
jgi:AcrR family transcriptional regulator